MRVAMRVGLAGLAAACASASAPPARPTASPLPAAQAVGVTLQELPPQPLESGQCALVLWSRTPKPERLIMALNDPALARVQIAGRLVELPQVEREGRQTYGHFSNQRYANERLSITLRVQFDPQENLVGGAVARDGALEIVDNTGWTAAIPVGGLVACQP